jgi:hypothetical protein
MEIKRIEQDFTVCQVKDYSLVNLDSEYSFIELMRTASLTVDRDMTICQCEYRKEGEQE